MKQLFLRAARHGQRVTTALIAVSLAASAHAGFFIPKDSRVDRCRCERESCQSQRPVC